MAVTLLPSLSEGLMGLREKHPVYRILFGFLFFNEGSPFNFKISGPEKNKWGWFSVPPDCSPNERCNSESMVGTMNRFEKEPSTFLKREGSQKKVRFQICDIYSNYKNKFS